MAASSRVLVVTLLLLSLVALSHQRNWIVPISAIAQYPTLRIRQGDAVFWQNSDGEAHTVTSADGLFDVTLQSGDEFSFQFVVEGTFLYSDLLHPNVGSGSVVVHDDNFQEPSVALSPIPSAEELSGVTFSSIDGFSPLSGNGVSLFVFAPGFDPPTTQNFSPDMDTSSASALAALSLTAIAALALV